MSEDRKVLLDRMRTSKELFVILSLCTKQPYVVCDPETFDDEVSMFFDEEEAKTAAKSLAEQKIPVTVGKLDAPQLLMYYTSLHTMGVNAVRVNDGEEKHLIQLDEIVKKIEQPEGKVWVENSSLYLTAIYYMQELRRQPNPAITEEMQQMQQEIAADFERGKYIVAISQEEKGIPLVKVANGDTYQPVFTDILEFQKFNRDNKFRPVIVEAAKIPQVLAKEAKGVVLNPLSVNMPMLLRNRTEQAAPAEQAPSDVS